MSEKKVRERNLTIILKKEKNNQKRTNTTELWFSSLISYLWWRETSSRDPSEGLEEGSKDQKH